MGTARNKWKTYTSGAAVVAAVLSTTAFSPNGGTHTVKTPTVACTEANTKLTTTLYPHDSAQHMLLTATNTGNRACTLFRYPLIIFPDRDGWAGPLESAMKDVTIAPGKKAYAGMLLFRVDAPTDAVKSMSVSLQGRVPNEDPDSLPIEVPMPGGFVNIDDNPVVSYWNASKTKAEQYMFKAAGGN